MRLYVRSDDRRPDPPPLVTNDRATVAVGMIAWAFLWLAAVVEHDRLVAECRGWWVWTPPAAIALGLLGLWYVHGRSRQN